MPETALISPYADFEYYSDTFGGSTIPESKFLYHENNAEMVLHRITFNRILHHPELIPDETAELIRKAVCAMAEVDFREKKKTQGVKSESIDGFSITYSDTGSASGEAGIAKAMYPVADIYLGGTGLLFKGRSRKYDC